MHIKFFLLYNFTNILIKDIFNKILCDVVVEETKIKEKLNELRGKRQKEKLIKLDYIAKQEN